MRILIMLSLAFTIPVSADESNGKEIADLGLRGRELGCTPLGDFRIIAKLADREYEISYQAGVDVQPGMNPAVAGGGVRFIPIMKRALLKTVKTTFTSDGVVEAMMTRKIGSTKVTLKNGFEEVLPAFEESVECKEIAERGSVLLEKKAALESSARRKREIAEEQKLEREERAKQKAREKQEKERQKKIEEFYE